MLRPTINKEEIAKLPLCGFEGEVVVVDNITRWQHWKEDILSHDVLGFDTETRPAFKKGQRNEVALIQLATEHRAYLIRLNKTGFLPGLEKLFSSENRLKIGVGLRDDIRELKRLYNFREKGFIDLQNYVRAFSIEDSSLVKITAIVMGCRISKSQQLSNWEAAFLSEKQMRYAATDAWAAYMIYRKLQQFVTTDED
ncbi:MAG: 3'-5' exonuclease domain-containing protein 2 [Chlorobi bacterium]|nr:3'-5' exonuclease domain-containing protein 2 [Chlorobiota bacterium]